MGRALRDAILAAEDLKSEVVDMRPFGWPGDVVMRELTGAEYQAYQSRLRTSDGSEHFDYLREEAVAASLRDAEGDRQFVTPEDVVELSKKSAAAINHLFDVYGRLNAAGAKGVEKVAKNFEPIPGDSASSGSRG